MEHPWSNVGYYLTQAAARRLWAAAIPISGVADWPAPVHRWPTAYCITPCLIDTSSNAKDSLLHAERAVLESESVPAQEEAMAMLQWSTPWRILGRLASLALLPSLLWPETFGTVENTKRFLVRLVDQLEKVLLGRWLEGRL